MKQTLNKLLFIFALVIVGNIIPMVAKADTIYIGTERDSNPMYLTTSFASHTGSGSDPFPANSTMTTSGSIVCDSWCFPTIVEVYITDTSYVPIVGDATSGNYILNSSAQQIGTISGSANFSTPSVNGTYFAKYQIDNVDGTILNGVYYLPFQVYSPAVTVVAYNNTNPASPVLLPQNASSITTTPVSPGTPLLLNWMIAGLNPGFVCQMPDGSYATINTAAGSYRTTAPSTTTNYPFSCSNPGTVSVTTNPVTSVTSSSALFSGFVSTTGGLALTDKGFAWSTAINPTTSNSYLSLGTGTGSFTGLLSGLSSSNSYYTRAYATSAALGTAYGINQSFTPYAASGSQCSSTVTAITETLTLHTQETSTIITNPDGHTSHVWNAWVTSNTNLSSAHAANVQITGVYGLYPNYSGAAMVMTSLCDTLTIPMSSNISNTLTYPVADNSTLNAVVYSSAYYIPPVYNLTATEISNYLSVPESSAAGTYNGCAQNLYTISAQTSKTYPNNMYVTIHWSGADYPYAGACSPSSPTGESGNVVLTIPAGSTTSSNNYSFPGIAGGGSVTSAYTQ